MRFGLFARSVGGGLGTSPLDGCEHSEGHAGRTLLLTEIPKNGKTVNFL